jgi:hypothetical protein
LAWNLKNATLNPTNKLNQLVKQRILERRVDERGEGRVQTDVGEGDQIVKKQNEGRRKTCTGYGFLDLDFSWSSHECE